jgi:mRNA-degrading endonuclease RelE of RelBE toxin-antitoxin system
MGRDPFVGDIVALKGDRTGYHRRVGDHRILFDVDHEARTVEIQQILRRTSTTYRRR